MGVLFKTGVFYKDQSGSNGATQDIILGFRPRAVIFWGEHHITTPGISGGDSFFSIGVSDGLHHRAICGAIDDNQAAVTDTMRTQRASAIVFSNADEVYLSHARSTFSIDRFTMIWDLNTDTTGTEIHYAAIGGTDVMAEVGTIPITTIGKQYIETSRLLQNINDEEGICFILSTDTPTIPLNTTPHSVIGIGAASSITNQFAVGHSSDNNIDNSLTGAYYSNVDCVRVGLGGIDTLIGTFAGFTGTGFAIDWKTVTANSLAFYLIIKGGQWKAGTETSKVSGGTKSTTTIFKPTGLLLASSRITSSTAAESKDISCDFGAADGINNNSTTQTDKNSSATSVTGRASSVTKCTRILNPSLDDTPIVGAEANLDSFNNTNFTLNWTTVDEIAHSIGYIICGDGLKYQKSVPVAEFGGSSPGWTDKVWGNKAGTLYDELDEIETDFLETAIHSPTYNSAGGFQERLSKLKIPDINNTHYQISFWGAMGSHINDTPRAWIEVYNHAKTVQLFKTPMINISSTIQRYSYILTAAEADIIRNYIISAPAADLIGVVQYVTLPYAIKNASNSGNSYDATADDTSPTMLSFKPDGTKMYVGGKNSIAMYQYALSTPWDITTFGVLESSWNFGAEDSSPEGFFWKPDGSTFYMVGGNSQTVYQYYVLDSADAWNLNGALQDFFTLGFSPSGISFKPDGTKMYIVNNTTNRIREYDLSYPWFVDTAVFLQEKDFTNNIYDIFNISNITDLYFREDGKQVFICSTTSGGVIHKYNLSIPWDITSIVIEYPYLSQFITGGEDTSPTAIYFKSSGLADVNGYYDGVAFFVVGDDTNTVFAYSIL